VYDLRALEIAGGKWAAEDVFFHSSPVYPYILGIIYSVFGHSYTAVRVIQVLFGVGSCLLLFFIARTLFGSREGLLAGLIAALYVPFIFFDAEILMITYVIFFALLSIWFLLRYQEHERLWLALAAGGAIGVSALGKPNMLLFVPAAALWLWWVLRNREGGRAKRKGKGNGETRASVFRAAGLLIAGAVLVVAPMTIMNMVAADDFVLTSSNGGINFWIGNNHGADGTFLVPQSMRVDLYGTSKMAAEVALGRSLKPSEVSSYWFDKGLDFVTSQPGAELKLLGRKLVLFWNAYEIPNHYDLNYFRQESKVLGLNPFLFSWIVPLGFMGMYVSRRHWRKHLVLYVFGVAYVVSLLPFFITSRYRLPIVPVMIVFCAHALWWIWRRVAARERHGWVVPAVVLVASLIIVNLPLVDFSLGPQYATIGQVYRDAGDYEEAARYYRLAIEESPEFDLAYNSLGSVLSRMGRSYEAERALLKALDINPNLASSHSNLGLVYMQTERLDQAKRSLLRATQEDPNLKPAWDNLAKLGIMTQDAFMAVSALEQSLRLDPNDAFAHWNLAIFLSAQAELREAGIYHARMAAALEPSLRGEAEALIRAITDAEPREE
ncbi:glycosyltransferase family 39 protein, partial [bacterium]|nr:glycosyltransferase family 39 protein [bacterium]